MLDIVTATAGLSKSITGTRSLQSMGICTATWSRWDREFPSMLRLALLAALAAAPGPHVHYEILVNGEPQDPERFIALAPLMSVTER